ncbi:alpha/beta hydrolase [Methylobacterium sp. 37f]|uniref:alpha/beta hydrolase n=1 Tax=Methylobacterium sp. 37f TaxID=2817058 RepID=UPI0032B52C3F
MMPEAEWRDLDRAALSRAYDNSAAVADSAARLAEWRARSAAFRARPGHSLDLPYDPGPPYGAGPRNRIDRFGCGRPGAPLLAFIHGGYWQRNAKEGFACLAQGPMALGLDVALIGYTLAPDASLTRIAAEIRSALRTLRAGDAAAGLGRRRLVVSGWSAGGHLAALALDGPEADAGLAISGIFDLAPIRGTTLDEALRLTPGEVETLSPIRRMTRPGAPLVLAYGADELPELRRQSRDYAAARAAAGLETRCLALEGADHFSILETLIDPEGALARLAAELAHA